MPLFVVTYEHPDEDGWKRHLMPHVAWLQERLKDGSLVASGPFPDTAVKSALLVMDAPDRAAVMATIATDPFALHGLIDRLSVEAWDPIFGILNHRSSMPGRMQETSS